MLEETLSSEEQLGLFAWFIGGRFGISTKRVYNIYCPRPAAIILQSLTCLISNREFLAGMVSALAVGPDMVAGSVTGNQFRASLYSPRESRLASLARIVVSGEVNGVAEARSRISFSVYSKPAGLVAWIFLAVLAVLVFALACVLFAATAHWYRFLVMIGIDFGGLLVFSALMGLAVSEARKSERILLRMIDSCLQM